MLLVRRRGQVYNSNCLARYKHTQILVEMRCTKMCKISQNGCMSFIGFISFENCQLVLPISRLNHFRKITIRKSGKT